MANKLDESRGPFYSLFIFFIMLISSLSLPLRFQSFGSNFTKFLDTYDRHYIFLLCNGILFFLLFDSGLNEAGPEAKKIECNEQVEDLETTLVLRVQDEHELASEVKQIAQNGMLVSVDDDHHHHRIEDSEAELVGDADYEHEIVAISEVEEEKHDDEDEFRQKCEEFIKKVRQSMHFEGEPISR